MSDPQTVRVRLDRAPYEGALANLASELRQLRELRLKLGESVLGTVETFPEARSVNVDSRAASATGEMRILLEPSDRLRDLLGTLRTINRDLLALKNRLDIHAGSPGCSAAVLDKQQPTPGQGQLPDGGPSMDGV